MKCKHRGESIGHYPATITVSVCLHVAVTLLHNKASIAGCCVTMLTSPGVCAPGPGRFHLTPVSPCGKRNNSSKKVTMTQVVQNHSHSWCFLVRSEYSSELCAQDAPRSARLLPQGGGGGRHWKTSTRVRCFCSGCAEPRRRGDTGGTF